MLLRGVLRRGGADFKTRMSLVQAGWDPYSSAKTVGLWPPQPLGTCAKVKGIEEYLESKDARLLGSLDDVGRTWDAAKCADFLDRYEKTITKWVNDQYARRDVLTAPAIYAPLVAQGEEPAMAAQMIGGAQDRADLDNSLLTVRARFSANPAEDDPDDAQLPRYGR